jgi:uncharacterized lipoprotein NlpE involved in copper resistance
MRKNIFVFLCLAAVLFVLGLGSCLSNQAPDIHSSRISIDWAGVYNGTTPAASGPGIEVQLLLNNDETFAIRYTYVDRPGSTFMSTGPFKWDKTGEIIILDVKDMPPYYKVAENYLIQLDMKGNMITGELADYYILRKVQ